MITLIELARLGWTMRKMQKQYFANRTQMNLTLAKGAEQKFDHALDELARAKSAPTLFAGQEGQVPR